MLKPKKSLHLSPILNGQYRDKFDYYNANQSNDSSAPLERDSMEQAKKLNGPDNQHNHLLIADNLQPDDSMESL